MLEAVKDAGIEDNTLIIFTSDNGGAHYIGLPEINKPFRGWKLTFFEGGIRVPMLVQMAGQDQTRHDVRRRRRPRRHLRDRRRRRGRRRCPPIKKLDGVNLMPFITGEAQGTPHQTMFWRSGGYKVLLAGDWKLQVSANPDKRPGSTI